MGRGNMVLVATGKLDFGQIVEWANQYMGSWSTVEAKRLQPPPQIVGGRDSMIDAKLNRQYTMALMPGPSAQDERRFAARVLSDVIGDSDGSRLYWALVDNAIAEEAEFGFYPHDGCGSYYLGLTTEPDRTRKAMDIALAELQKAKQDLNDEEVDRARNKIASRSCCRGSAAGRMRAIGGQWVYNEEYRSLEQIWPRDGGEHGLHCARSWGISPSIR